MKHGFLIRPFLAGVFFVCGVPFLYPQTQVTINPIKDNTLYESGTGALSNGAGSYFFVGRTNQTAGESIRRGLLAFDIAGNVPPGATITSVTLTLNMSKTTAGAHTVSLHRVLADWGEGTSNAGGEEGSGASSTTGDATWIHRFFDTTNWVNAGGDFSSTPSASQSVGGVGSYTWGSTSGMVADVQQWLNSPSMNFGWLLLGNESTARTAKRFDTKEHPTSANRPRLTITYTVPPQPVLLKDSAGAVVGSFTTITAAYAALPDPIDQRYLIEIQTTYDPATETVPIVLTSRTGTSTDRTITIRPAADVSALTISRSVSTPAVLQFNGADWVILDGRAGGSGTAPTLIIQNTSTGSDAQTIQFINGATNNIVRYVHSKNATVNTTGPRNIEFGTSTDPAGNSFNLLQNCIVEGGRSGIASSGTTANPNVGNVIKGCTIFDWGHLGVWFLSANNDMTVDSCVIYTNVGSSNLATDMIAIAFQLSSTYTAKIRGNRIFNILSNSTSTSLTLRGIDTRTGPGTGSVLAIENNFVSLPYSNQNAATVYGIKISGTNAFTANVYYNTVRLGGTHSGGLSGNIVSAALLKSASSAAGTCNIKNNIFINDRSGGTSGVIHTGGAVTSDSGTFSMDYNAHYVTAANPAYHAVWLSIGYDSLSSYRAAAAPNEQHSVFRAVTFVSSSDLHLAGGSIGDINLAGIPIPGIDVDIDGHQRPATSPYMGADERPEAPLAGTPPPAPLLVVPADGAMISADSVVFSWRSTDPASDAYWFENATDSLFVNSSVDSTLTDTTTTLRMLVDGQRYWWRVRGRNSAGWGPFSAVRSYRIVLTAYQEVEDLPQRFSLDQNYPNPFNPTTVIRYHLPKAGYVTLKVYNLVGQELTTLVNEVKQGGRYEVQFDGAGLASGVYFYRLVVSAGGSLSSEHFVETKKFVVLK